MRAKKLILVCSACFFMASHVFAYKYIGDTKDKSDHEKSIMAGCVVPSGATIFDYNNVRTTIYTGGDMWWDLQGTAKYEIPKGSGKTSLFAGAIWIGGTDVNGQLRVCGARYRQIGQDYYAGPLKESGPDRGNTTPEMCQKYDKHFPVSKNEVAEFRAWYRAKNNPSQLSQFANYSIPENILNWPAINTEPFYSYYLAPFWDENHDGEYNPEDGDYPFFDLDKEVPCGTTPDKRRPRLYGDKLVWWVYNDKGNIHTETKGAAVGMEIRAQYFAFSTNDELNNMTFGNYALINRSTYTLQDCYFGVWTDGDLGDGWDDYAGTDVNRGLSYVYNGDEMDGDGNGQTYGAHPPAVGVDYFEGPYQDPDGFDNRSNWDTLSNGTAVLDCHRAPLAEGSINGLNFEDGIIDDERWGMRRFVYFKNSSGAQGDPDIAIEYYRYLRGYWKDGTRMTYGGTGYHSSSTEADFMFPDVTDPCGWGTNGIPQTPWRENDTPTDSRLVQSAGPFTLLPGATNDITVGMVWARATTTAWASIAELQRADDKAQRLFNVCFKLVDGPNAPEMQIIEMDKKLIFHIYNEQGSNNYVNKPEDYIETDPFIVCPTNKPKCDTKYRFQGYQVFQLKDQSCSVNDITDITKARQVFQCDIKDSVTRLINFEFDNQLGYSVPVLKVDGTDAGIQHSFEITEDAFATEDKRLVNHKTYYFVAIAYAYNCYQHFVPDDPDSLSGQKSPYLASRIGNNGKQISVYPAMPHIPSPSNNGTILNSDYGYGPKIIQVDGHGNGNNELKLTEKTVQAILSSPLHRTDSVEYENGYGPILVKVIDPLNVQPNDFVLKFDSVQMNADNSVKYTRWVLYRTSNPDDTVYSESSISIKNEQLIAKWGISVTIQQVPWPAQNNPYAYQNGCITSSITWQNPNEKWLDFIPDVDGCDFPNWIRSGTTSDINNSNCNDLPNDKQQFFEKVVEGTWAPYLLGMVDKPGSISAGYKEQTKGVQFHRRLGTLNTTNFRLSSVMIVFTKDKSKWSRCPVIETADFDLKGGSTSYNPGIDEGNVKKFQIRKHASVDKEGRTTTIGDSTNANAANYISANGMGWFPGYAIDMETGDRLNIVFGENSQYPVQNGRDMMFNPTSNYASDLYYTSGGTNGDWYIGGQHYIWVFGHNDKPGSSTTQVDSMPAYDNGAYLNRKLKQLSTLSGSNYDIRMAFMWNNAMWVSIPMLSATLTPPTTITDPYWFIKTDATVRISVAEPYQQTLPIITTNRPNNGYPMYLFSTKDLSPVTHNDETAKNSLDLIRVVPNPYYGYNAYENSQLDNKVRITNLPQKCTISIYNVSGTLIRRFKKDSPLSYQDWDLKNEYSITIASGVYIVHIDAPGIGEKILKWFGALRPIDLNNF